MQNSLDRESNVAAAKSENNLWLATNFVYGAPGQ